MSERLLRALADEPKKDAKDSKAPKPGAPKEFEGVFLMEAGKARFVRKCDLDHVVEVEPGLYVRADGFAQASAAGNRALVACADSDEKNVYITLSARAMRPDIVIVARASSLGLTIAGALAFLAPLATRLIGRLLSVVMPKTGLLGLDPNAVSRDPAVVQDYLADPLVYKGKISARLAADLLRQRLKSYGRERIVAEAAGHRLIGQAAIGDGAAVSELAGLVIEVRRHVTFDWVVGWALGRAVARHGAAIYHAVRRRERPSGQSGLFERNPQRGGSS